MDCNLGLEHPTRTPETPKSNFLYFTVRQCFGYRESNNSFSNQKITQAIFYEHEVFINKKAPLKNGAFPVI